MKMSDKSPLGSPHPSAEIITTKAKWAALGAAIPEDKRNKNGISLALFIIDKAGILRYAKVGDINRGPTWKS